MKRVLLAIAVLLLLATSARAQNYAACQVNGIITVCPDNVRLKTGKTLIETYIPSLDASKIGSGTFAVARLPTAIPAINIGGGGVDNTEFGYLDGVTSSVQTQLNALLPASSNKLPPTPTAANKLLYDTGSTYAETAACSSTSTVLVGGSPPACAAVPDAALSSNVVTLTGTQTLTNKTISGSSNTITNLNLNASATSGGVVYAAVTGEIAITFSTSTKYMQAPTGSTAGAASETRLVCLGPRFASGTYKARNLQVHLVTAPGASGTNTFKVNLWHAGSWTTTGTPTCAISGATGNQDCSDSSTAITVTQGDCVGIEDAANIFSAGAGATATVEVTN